MNVHVLGVSASPRRAATHVLVQAALMGSAAIGASTTYVSLADKGISPCNGCEPCMVRSRCVIDDDMTPLYDELLAADVIVLGTPVYFGAPSAMCKAFMERIQGLGIQEKRLRLKVGGGIASGAGKNAGQESALMALHLWFLMNDMLPVGITSPASQWGMTAQTGFDPGDVERDVFQLRVSGGNVGVREAAWLYGRKLATVGSIVKAGLERTKLDLPDSPYGFGIPSVFPSELADLHAREEP